MNRFMNRRYVLKLIVMGAGVAALAACGSPSASAGSSTEVSATATVNGSQTAATVTNAPAAIGTATTAVTVDTTALVAVSTLKFNLNTATESQFLTVPNVGARMVREFNEYRPYSSIKQFRTELGKYIDANQVAEYEKYVFVPVKPNESDSETLQQLGIDAATADKLIAARPYASRDSFLAELGKHITAEQLKIVSTYVEGE